jgi:DNA-binding beta-propeller fold protein YncE
MEVRFNYPELVMKRIACASARAVVTAFVIVVCSVCLVSLAVGQISGYANFEGSQANPIRLSADGTRLFVVNTPNASLSVFNVTTPATPKLIAEIPVGVEPVSVNPRTDNEAWVVNEVSNSVSVVSVSQGIVTDTIKTGPEPHDVVFAGGMAFVSISRNNIISAFNVATHALVASIPVFGGSPRALAVDISGNRVFAAMAISGNATTLIPETFAPPQCGNGTPPNTTLCSPPINPALPPPPQVGLIVQATDPNWTNIIKFKMPDRDVAVISTGSSPAVVGYYSGVGTINLGLAVNPVSGDLFVTNTDALNLIHFENNLLSHFANNRVTRIARSTGVVTPVDLNPGIYSVPPTQALTTALAQPAGIVFNPNGQSMWIAAFGTDRVANVDTSGNVLSFIDIAQASGAGANVDPKNKKGPRGLAFNAAAKTLYVSNRISNTLMALNTSLGTVLSEVPIGYDPTPAVVHQGRGFLYDAKLSGYGTGSCASCHVDGDMDHLAWDLGDPTASLSSVVNNGNTITFHPMKGPMTTQTLKGLSNLSPYHWRGDHIDFAAFNTAFQTLLGAGPQQLSGGSQLSSSDMSIYTQFVNTLLFPPNPNQNLDRSFPTSLSFANGNPAQGASDFENLALMTTLLNGQIVQTGKTCNTCHTTFPSGPGSSRVIQPTHSSQPLKIPQLRNIYQKFLREPVQTAEGLAVIDGFGVTHDGGVAGISQFLATSNFVDYTAQEITDIIAFELCFDTGTAPAVGYTRTLTSATLSSAASDWSTLESQAAAGNVDLVVRGTVSGVVHGLLYSPASNTYTLDTGTIYTHAQLQTFIAAGDVMSIMGVYPGTGTAAVGTIL